MTDILKQAANIKFMHDTERKLWEAYQEAELDVRVAARAGTEDIIDAAKIAHADARTAWHKAYTQAQAETAKLVSVLGLDAARVKASL